MDNYFKVVGSSEAERLIFFLFLLCVPGFTTFIFIIVIFKNTLSWEFLANLHLNLPYV